MVNAADLAAFPAPPRTRPEVPPPAPEVRGPGTLALGYVVVGAPGGALSGVSAVLAYRDGPVLFSQSADLCFASDRWRALAFWGAGLGFLAREQWRGVASLLGGVDVIQSVAVAAGGLPRARGTGRGRVAPHQRRVQGSDHGRGDRRVGHASSVRKLGGERGDVLAVLHRRRAVAGTTPGPALIGPGGRVAAAALLAVAPSPRPSPPVGRGRRLRSPTLSPDGGEGGEVAIALPDSLPRWEGRRAATPAVADRRAGPRARSLRGRRSRLLGRGACALPSSLLLGRGAWTGRRGLRAGRRRGLRAGRRRGRRRAALEPELPDRSRSARRARRARRRGRRFRTVSRRRGGVSLGLRLRRLPRLPRVAHGVSRRHGISLSLGLRLLAPHPPAGAPRAAPRRRP